ncbi:MAG: hypothetical protein LBQ21_07155 [Clostridiales Family XIII bacterium]|jgi:hypothetical protein|nr:hypothetical protein [Clostridiales Family XIII bacterium]
MSNEKRKILMLVEGAKTDFRLMKHLLHVYGIDGRHQIVSYDTNIYALYDTMFRNANPADMDILQHLKEHEPNPARKILFDKHYSDILLVFDLDPHDRRFSCDEISELAAFFVESSDMGKLYLNYPMVELFYHMKSIPDPDYDSYIATLEELRDKSYKSRVNAENRNHDYTKFAVGKRECDIVIRQNIDKALRLTNDEGALPPNSRTILKNQLEKLQNVGAIDVLCTCAFYIADYNPKLLL